MKTELSSMEQDVAACARHWLREVEDTHTTFTMPADVARKIFSSIVALASRCSNEIRSEFPLPGEDPVAFVARLDAEHRRLWSQVKA
jgi:hypothetical protein